MGVERYDVAVVGGGSAGIAAAVTAARCGARTLLAERSDVLGGNATQALVHTICGLYLPAAEGEAIHAHRGFPRRFADELRRAGGAATAERAGRVYVLPICPPVFAACAARLCERTPGLEVRSRCELTGAQLTASAGPSRLVLSGGGRREVEAQVVIDASGDASAGSLGGAETAAEAPERLQFPSLIFCLRGVDGGAAHGFSRLKLSHAVAGAARCGELPAGCGSVLVRPGAEADEVYVTLNVPKLAGRPYAPLDAGYLEALEEKARSSAEVLVDHLRRTRRAFRDATVAAWPRRIGIRETRRLRGECEITRADVLAGRRRDDEVAVSTWPIELWHDHRGARFEYAERPCSVALGSLVSRSHPRLGMAGRCLSATHEALGALRVIGTSMATGEAIGAAAARAADGARTLREIAPAEVRAAIEAVIG
jgi:hypothetical protein